MLSFLSLRIHFISILMHRPMSIWMMRFYKLRRIVLFFEMIVIRYVFMWIWVACIVKPLRRINLLRIHLIFRILHVWVILTLLHLHFHLRLLLLKSWKRLELSVKQHIACRRVLLFVFVQVFDNRHWTLHVSVWHLKLTVEKQVVEWVALLLVQAVRRLCVALFFLVLLCVVDLYERKPAWSPV